MTRPDDTKYIPPPPPPPPPTITLAGWGYIYNIGSGKLVSEATVIADPLPIEYRLVERAKRLDPDTERWDASAENIVPYRNTDRVAALTQERDRITVEITRLQSV